MNFLSEHYRMIDKVTVRGRRARRMVILMCILNSIGVKSYLKKGLNMNIKPMGIAVINFGLTLFCYCYYMGYKVSDLKAIFGITRNAFYCVVISVIIAACMCIAIRVWEMESSHIKCNTETINKNALIIIALLAFAVRIIGINWGAGETFHPDEGKVVRPPISMALNNTFMSDETLYPTQITSKVLSVIFKIWMLLAELADIEVTKLSYVCIARFYIAILSTGVVICIFFIAEHLKRNAGMIAAALAAVFLPFVQAAHCVTGDTFVALCICLAILCAFRYLKENRDYLWVFLMSLVAVLAALDKYHGIVICYIIALVVCIKQIQQKSYHKIVVQGLFAVSVVIGSVILIVPNLVINMNEIIDSLFHLTNDYETGVTFIQNMWMYLIWFLAHAGILTLPFMLIGFIDLIKSKKREALILTIGLIEIIAICLQNRHFIRWGYPLYVVLLILTGIGMVCLIKSERFMSAKRIKVLVLGGIILVGINGVAGTALVDVLYANSQLDTRIVSEEWCLENDIRQDDCIYDQYTCWSPGGMVSRYNWTPQMSLENSIELTNDSLLINRLGRKYAVSNATRYPDCILEKMDISKVACFKADYVFSDSGFGGYGSIWKILEPYSIYGCVRNCINILKNHSWFGSDIIIYDISMLPAYELIPLGDNDSEEECNWGVVDSISAGKYLVEVVGNEVERDELILESEEGEVVSICELENGFGQFSLDQHYYQLRIKTNQEYEYLKISQQ